MLLQNMFTSMISAELWKDTLNHTKRLPKWKTYQVFELLNIMFKVYKYIVLMVPILKFLNSFWIVLHFNGKKHYFYNSKSYWDFKYLSFVSNYVFLRNLLMLIVLSTEEYLLQTQQSSRLRGDLYLLEVLAMMSSCKYNVQWTVTCQDHQGILTRILQILRKLV